MRSVGGAKNIIRKYDAQPCKRDSCLSVKVLRDIASKINMVRNGRVQISKKMY
jgi:hypothetical protein